MPEVIVCKTCKRKFEYELTRGKKPIFCSEACRTIHKKDYLKKYQPTWYKNNRKKWNDYFNDYSKDRRTKLRLEVLIHYGGNPPKCACCGENEIMFLTIDHPNNDGAKHRREIGRDKIYIWLIKNNFPKGFRVLCMNCNWGRTRNGGICPHKNRNV